MSIVTTHSAPGTILPAEFVPTQILLSVIRWNVEHAKKARIKNDSIAATRHNANIHAIDTILCARMGLDHSTTQH